MTSTASTQSSGNTPDILKRICAKKYQEIAAIEKPERRELEKRAGDAAPALGFIDALRRGPDVAVIAEIKKASPSAGIMRPDFDPESIARTYQRAGAACISVLTDAPFFSGSLRDLETVRRTAGIPLLRKDFILDGVQIVQSRAFGADCVLLIAAALEDQSLKDLLICAREWGLDALVEVHTECEMRMAEEAGAPAIGINNRNLHTFVVDLAVTEQLAAGAPRGAPLVSESGIHGREDIRRLARSGIDAVLVGETLMRAADTDRALGNLRGVEKRVGDAKGEEDRGRTEAISP